MKDALVSTLVVAAIATAGDWIWATFLSGHLTAAGLVHGALLCLAIGAMVGRPVARAGAGASAGVGVGIAAAALFYLLAPLMGLGAMFPAWFTLWVLVALLYHRLAKGSSAGLAIVRGMVAGTASGLAFYLISGMWTRWDPQAINYADHFARWAFAFAPGFVAIQGGRPRARTSLGPPI